MGMFDWVKSSYPLPEPFMGTCQTKDVEDCYGGSLTHYWIDPEGYLWYGDYRKTSTFELIEEDDPRYDADKLWMNYEWVSTGERGKFQVFPLTKFIEVYPAEWSGDWAEWPRLRLLFKRGKLIEWEDITGR